MNALLALLSFAVQTATAINLAPVWEVLKGVMLFVITAGVSWIAKMMWTMRQMVFDHEIAIYGRDNVNGLKRGAARIEERVGLIEDRNIALDAVAEAERAQYPGPERRHDAVRQLIAIIKREIEAGGGADD